jgi:uncharacterized RmlC-like cupin family protein
VVGTALHTYFLAYERGIAMPETKNTETITHSTPTCQVIRSNDIYVGRQGLNYFTGISVETVGARGICMHLVKMPPGARANAHLHENHETAIYVLQGEVQTWYDQNLEHCLVVRAGEFLYIPAGEPHLPVNVSQAEAVAVLARTDPNEQESVVLLPDLDTLHK